MKERPILFSAPMVRAILDGRKTMTRRVVKKCGLWETTGGQGMRPMPEACSHGKVGDRLWVRETWQGPLLEDGEWERSRQHGIEHFKKSKYCVYKASNNLVGIDDDGNDLVWKPSIHMFRWASRIDLEITGVRVERLNEISEADSIAEGVKRWIVGEGWREYGLTPAEEETCGPPMATAKESFGTLWESINGPESWNANPWVWVVEFKRIKP